MGTRNATYHVTQLTDEEIHEAAERLSKAKKKKRRAIKKSLSKDVVKVITVKFRSERDANKFASLIHQNIPIKERSVIFEGRSSGNGSFVGQPRATKRNYGLKQCHKKHWVGMPEFEQEDSKWEWHRIKVEFTSWEDYKKFAIISGQNLRKSTASIYYPKWTPFQIKNYTWQSTLPKSKKNPRYPVYVISKGRSVSRLTSKALEAMNVPYHIVVEPQDYDDYSQVIAKSKIIVIPEDTDTTKPTGPGRARNFCRDHAWLNGHKRHWVMDDNIEAFYRLHKNRRYRVGDGAIFRAAEDFVDRYKNILVSGFQYRFFCAAKSKYPPFVRNTRIYSCLLIDNSKLFKWKNGKREKDSEVPILVNAPKGKPMGEKLFLWRERYNEDTILSLDSLENGCATVQFNAFLQGKMGTQKLAGGNSDMFYKIEKVDGKEWSENSKYNDSGTIRKSLTLEKLYPNVAELVTKFQRPHHEVNYKLYKKFPLLFATSVKRAEDINNYGMQLSDKSEKRTNYFSGKINATISNVFEETGKKAFGDFLEVYGKSIKLPQSALPVFEGALNFHDKKRASQAKEMALIERRWYQSLKRGKPDYSVYGLPYYYIDLWVCWCRYSRRYLKEIQAPKSLFGKSIVSAIKAKTVVDLGCGFGYTTAALKEIFPNASVIGTNLKGTSQYNVSEALGKERNFSVSASIPKADLLFASEYFEHHQEPIKHLKEVLKNANPKYMLIANAFGTRAIGHFEHYLHDGKRVSAKEMARMFSAALKSFGWQKVKTACWNNRPQFWVKST